MADASYTQSSFLGGQWSPAAQGRIDAPDYKIALDTCLNSIPVEEGSWTRRGGTRQHGIIRGNGQIKEFELPNNQKMVLEFTAGVIRFWITASIMGSGVGYQLLNTAGFTTPYNTIALCQAARVIQTDNNAFVLCPGIAPQILVCSNYNSVGPGVVPVLTFSAADFHHADGPYLDPPLGASQTGNGLAQINSMTGDTVTIQITDGTASFAATDVGRQFRFWQQPPAWNSATAYTVGQYVSYNGLSWIALLGGAANAGIVPGTLSSFGGSGQPTIPVQGWSISTTISQWFYGYISTVSSSTTAIITITDLWGLPVLPGGQNWNGVDTFQFGAYNPGLNLWPVCGTYHEGRIWLGGAIPNRFDASMTNSAFDPASPNFFPLMSPTDQYGNVYDNNGISYTVASQGSNLFLWMQPDHNGILCGTASGEWLIQASTLNDPLTPTSIQAHKITAYKCQNSEPIRMGIAIAFIQSFGRRLLEYTVDVFSQKFIGRHLNEFAKDLTTKGLLKITYQEELAPIIWALTNDNKLIGCTYRRVSHFGQEAPVFKAWHTHTLGSDRTIQWICMGSDNTGTQDVLILLTQDKDGICYFEQMTPIFDVDTPLYAAQHLDSFCVGQNGLFANITGPPFFFNISTLPVNYEGSLVRVFLAGLDCGSYTVSHGTISIPFGSDPDGYFNMTWIEENSNLILYGDSAITAAYGANSYTLPLILGFPFLSKGKLLRPMTVEQVRTQTGPGVGKTRRNSSYAMHLVNTITGAQIAVDNRKARTQNLVAQDRRTHLDHVTLFTGIKWEELDDDNTFDGQISWSTSSPYPMTVASISGFIHTQER